MKHDRLCAIGHNLADSLASGLCFVIGYHPTDIFGEAALNKDGTIGIDFLHGRIVRGVVSAGLRPAIARFGEVFPKFCRGNEAKEDDFETLSALFDATELKRRVLLSRNGPRAVHAPCAEIFNSDTGTG
jgi:hypothetical protein